VEITGTQHKRPISAKTSPELQCCGAGEAATFLKSRSRNFLKSYRRNRTRSTGSATMSHRLGYRALPAYMSTDLEYSSDPVVDRCDSDGVGEAEWMDSLATLLSISACSSRTRRSRSCKSFLYQQIADPNFFFFF
jgi:hypothetical protein